MNGFSNIDVDVESNVNTKVALNLGHLGISTTVLTTIGEIHNLISKFKNKPDNSWWDGLGKKTMHKMLLKIIKNDDVYFTLHPNEVNSNNDKWNEFCYACFFVLVLDAFLKGQVIKILHLDLYKNNLVNNPYDGTNSELPDLIVGATTTD